MAEQEKVGNEQEIEIKNELEFLINAGREGKVSLATLFQALLRTPVYMVLDREVKVGESMANVQSLMVKDDAGDELLTLFTGKDRCEHLLGKYPGYDHATEIPAYLLLDSMRDDMGLVINPGMAIGIRLDAAAVRDLKRNFGEPILQNIPDAEEGKQSGNG